MSRIGRVRVLRQHSGRGNSSVTPVFPASSFSNPEIRQGATDFAVSDSGEDHLSSLRPLVRLLARQAARNSYRGRGFSEALIAVPLLLMALLLAAAIAFCPHLLPGH